MSSSVTDREPGRNRPEIMYTNILFAARMEIIQCRFSYKQISCTIVISKSHGIRVEKILSAAKKNPAGFYAIIVQIRHWLEQLILHSRQLISYGMKLILMI